MASSGRLLPVAASLHTVVVVMAILCCFCCCFPVRIGFARAYVGVALEAMGLGRLLLTNDAGASWHAVATASLSWPSHSRFRDIAVVDSHTIVVVGDAGLLIVLDEPFGAWTRRTISAIPNAASSLKVDLRAVAFNANLLGGRPDAVPLQSLVGIAVGEYGMAIRTLDRGASWTRVRTNTVRDINALAWDRNSTTVYGVGNLATVLVSRDSGATFSVRDASHFPLVSGQRSQPNLLDVVVVPGEHGSIVVAVGTFATVMRSNDFGVSWIRADVKLPVRFDPATTILQGVSFRSRYLALAVGSEGLVITSQDQGVHWNTLSTAAMNEFGTENLYGISMITSSLGIIGARTRLFTTSSGGSVWEPARRMFISLLPRAAVAANSARSISSLTTSTPSSSDLGVAGGVNNTLNHVVASEIMLAGVLVASPPQLTLQVAMNSEQVQFTVTLHNSGTYGLVLLHVNISDSRVVVPNERGVVEMPMSPFGAQVLYTFRLKPSLFSAGSHTIIIDFVNDSPGRSTSVTVLLQVNLDAAATSTAWLKQYWYTFLLGSIVLLAVTWQARSRYISLNRKRERRMRLHPHQSVSDLRFWPHWFYWDCRKWWRASSHKYRVGVSRRGKHGSVLDSDGFHDDSGESYSNEESDSFSGSWSGEQNSRDGHTDSWPSSVSLSSSDMSQHSAHTGSESFSSDTSGNDEPAGTDESSGNDGATSSSAPWSRSTQMRDKLKMPQIERSRATGTSEIGGAGASVWNPFKELSPLTLVPDHVEGISMGSLE